MAGSTQDSPSSDAKTRGRVLVVEDDAHIRDLVVLHLQLEGLTTVAAADGATGLRQAKQDPFDLLILDVMLPELDGVTVCRAVRRESMNGDVPILMLTARREETDKVLGLESGADDYLTKPFGVRELMARIGALMRRHVRQTVEQTPPTMLQTGDLSLDRERRQATVRGERVELTKQEFDLLYLVASRPGAVFTRAALLEEVWSDDTYVTDRTVDTVISRLRRKIERDPQDSEVLLTAWGVGYKFADRD